MKVSDWIAAQRMARNWTQTELARRIGKTRQAVQQYEKSKILPRPEVMKKLREVFK